MASTQKRITTAVMRREDAASQESRQTQHQPKTQNALKIKIDNLRTLSPLTENQATFFDMYKRGDYCIGVLGSAGTGKCQGENVEVSLLVQDEFYEKFIK